MTKRFNNTIELKTRFRNMIRSDFSQSSIGQCQRAVEEALGPLPYVVLPLNQTWAYIRARVIDEEREDVTHPGTFASPPPRETTLGRANLTNQPVFYATFDAGTAMAELKVDYDTECYVSIWENTGQKLHLAQYLAHADPTNDLLKKIDALPNTIPDQILKSYTLSAFKMAMKLRSEIFEHDNYDLSSRLAHEASHNNQPNTHGVLYPSAFDPNRCNVAIHPDFVSHNLHCIRVYKFIYSPGFIFRMLARATNENGTLVWKETGKFDLDQTDWKYSGSFGPSDIHPKSKHPFNPYAKKK